MMDRLFLSRRIFDLDVVLEVWTTRSCGLDQVLMIERVFTLSALTYIGSVML